MERFMVKTEPYWSQEIEEIVNIENHSLTDEKPNNIKLEYVDNNISSTPICFGNYFKTEQEFNCSYKDRPIQEVKNDNLEKIDNHLLIEEKPNNVKLEYSDNNTKSIPVCSTNYFKIKQELDCSHEDHSIQNGNNGSTDRSPSKLRNATIVLKRLSILEILKYTKKSEIDSEYTYRLNVDAMKYVCVYSCLKCDGTVDIKSIRHIINRPQCGCTPTLIYQCTGCNNQFGTYTLTQKHINTKGLCESRKKFLHLEGFNDVEREKLNCPKCNTSLENIAQFTKHVNDCKEVSKFWCSFCDYGTKHNDHLRKHLKIHASLSTKSKSVFTSEESMQNEYNDRIKKFKTRMKETVCYCSTCNETSVKRVFKILSNTCNKCGTPYTYRYRCPECNKEFSRRTSVLFHLKTTCNASKDYRCSVCKEKEFPSFDQLQKHMSHCGKTLYLNCKFCPFETKRTKSLRLHLLIRHFKNGRSFNDSARDEGPLYELFCEQCSEPKENGECGNRYYYCLKCKTKLWLQCQKCNVVYKSRRRFTNHITSNCGLNDELQKCPDCKRQYKNLNFHIDNCRDIIKYCAHCPYNTKKKHNLNRHLFSIHRDLF